jgi:heptaprenyl diphosphate synthase
VKSPKPAPADRGAWEDKARTTALLGAFCFFLSTIEYMIPKPLPFMRLGIANLPILLAVDILPLPWFLTLAAVKVIGMSLVSGSLFSFIALFSLTGTMVAALTMWAARKAGGKAISAIGVSVLGATASNAAQVFLATVLVFGEAAKLIAPVFLGMGLATGLVLGVFAELFARRSRWIALATGKAVPQEAVSAEASAEASGGRGRDRAARGGALAARRAEARRLKRERRQRRAEAYGRHFDPTLLAAGGAAVSVAYLAQGHIALRAAMCASFLIVSLLAGKSFSALGTTLVMAGVVLANLAVPMGEVIGYIGDFTITKTALVEGIDKALVFEGLVFISKASILPTLKLPGTLGGIVASAFAYYGKIVEHRARLRPAYLMRDVDELLLTMWETPLEPVAAAAGTSSRRRAGTIAGVCMIAAAVAISFALLLA